jgi:cytochrome P450
MVASRAIAPTMLPEHVPADLVREISLAYSPEFLADPYRLLSSMHENYPPVFYTPGGGANPAQWMFTKHADCLRILREADTFTSKGTTPFPRDPDDWFWFIPVEIEPPEHRKYRNLLDPFFSPTGVLRLQQQVRDLANDLIDGFIDRGHCEFTEEFSRPLPVSVFLGIMGLPQDRRDQFVKWTMDLLHSQDLATVQKATDDIGAYLKEAIAERREKPDNGALSGIVHGQIDGRPMTDKEIFGFAFFVFIAGIDTVYATFNNVWNWLAANPERRHEILAEPDNIANVVEELHRVFTVTFSGRVVKRDAEIGGVQLKTGDRVMSVLPAANFDPAVWDNPREVNFHRPRKSILAFAGGVHSCMGAHLARLEMKVCLQEFLRRIPDFQVKPGTELQYLPGGVIGPKRLPLEW